MQLTNAWLASSSSCSEWNAGTIKHRAALLNRLSRKPSSIHSIHTATCKMANHYCGHGKSTMWQVKKKLGETNDTREIAKLCTIQNHTIYTCIYNYSITSGWLQRQVRSCMCFLALYSERKYIHAWTYLSNSHTQIEKAHENSDCR